MAAESLLFVQLHLPPSAGDAVLMSYPDPSHDSASRVLDVIL